MNIMINSYCNLKCPYCFAQKTMHDEGAMNMSLSDFKKCLNFLKASDMKEVRLIGGEPTLHPQLERILDMIIDDGFFEDILIFSNFNFSQEVAEMLVKKSKFIRLRFLPNINDLEIMLPNIRENVLRNFDFITTMIPTMRNLSINLYSPNMNLKPYEDLVCRYDLKTIRFSVVLPNKKLSDDFDTKAYFHSFQPLLNELLNWRIKYGVSIDNDCNSLPLCCFDNDFLVKALKSNMWGFFEHEFCDSLSIDITPDLKVNGCFVCSIENPKSLEEFKNFEEMGNYLREYQQKQYGNKVVFEDCLSCPKYLTYHNCCTCLVYRKVDI